MRAGRNDPCPCGSGKKYKKCCLAKDQEADRARPENQPLAPPVHQPRRERDRPPLPFQAPAPPGRPPDPRQAALDARWQEFEARDYEGQIALFLQTLDEPELMDEEMAFEMLNQLADATVKHNERERFERLLEALRQRRPEVYASEAHHCLSWLIDNALAAGRRDALPSLARDLAPHAGRRIDEFNLVVDQLAYHGELAVLVEMMRLAWPGVKKSKDILAWAVEEFADRAAEYELFAYLEQTSSPDPGDRALLGRLEFFLDTPDPGRLSRHLKHLTEESGKAWALSDFEMRPPRRRSRGDFEDDEEEERPEDPGRTNLHQLSFEFLGWLRRRQGVPWTKGELARGNLVRYLEERHAGRLDSRESMLEAMTHPRKHKPPRRKPDHPLCPDRETLDCYLGQLLGILSMQYYDVAAVWASVPAWLRFLTARDLLGDEQRHKTLQQLAPLNADLLKIWESCPSDPALGLASKPWEQDEVKPEAPTA